jgi:hypothetical protein
MSVIERTPEQTRRKLAEMLADSTTPSEWHFKRADRVMEEAGLVPASDLRGAVDGWERIAKLAGWIIRDRNEADKVTAYAGELEALVRRHGGR